MSKPTGLRTQLVLALALMIAVATVSVGAITIWATRYQVTELQLDHGRLVGRALARVLTPALDNGPALQRAASEIAAGRLIRRLEVVEPRGKTVAVAGRGGRTTDPGVRQAMRLGQQRLQVVEEGGELGRLVVVSPMFGGGGEVVGAVLVELEAGERQLRWPVLFWVLMVFDGLMLVLFVGYALTRYAVRPLGRLQRAALKLAEGDLSTTVEPEGAIEFMSLAESFNTMTGHLRDQLERLEQQRAELVATREQVIRSEKLASVGRLAAGVAHEVGNPLQAIMGFTQMLLQGGAGLDGEKREDYLGRIKTETERIHRIIRELLDYARPVEDEVERVELSAVVAQAVQLVGPQKKLKEVELRREEIDELPPVAANTQRLVQVLVNLLLNAADAVCEGDGAGTVTIRGRALEEQQRVELAVSNTGPAIPLGDRGRVFDPFFTTKDPGQGTGLGLSVAQSIVESYGGRLTLADGEATTFVVALRRWDG